MTYTRNIPIAGESLGSTRDRIRENFQQNALVEEVNHVAFGAIGQGKHKYVTMPAFLTYPNRAPPPPGIPGEGVIWTTPSISKGASVENNLFFTPDGSTVEAYQLTRCITTDTNTFATFVNYPVAVPVANQYGGWTFIPGGMLLQYGRMTETSATSNSTPVTFPIPFNSTPFSITVTRNQSAASTTTYGVGNITTTGFNFRSNNKSIDVFYWMAIGG